MRPSPELDPNNPRFRGSYYGGYAGNTQVPPLDPARPWDVGGYLAVRRGDQVGRLLDERTDLACVLAECENPDPVARLNGLPAIEQHWKVVRALVPLKGPAGTARQNP
jgi:hypothetical protein